MPKGILSRFIVIAHNLIEQQEWVWLNGVILAQEGARAEVIQDEYGREIQVRVTGTFRRDLLAFIRTELGQIHASFGERLKYEEWVPCNCPGCQKSKTPENYTFERLKKFVSDK